MMGRGRFEGARERGGEGDGGRGGGGKCARESERVSESESLGDRHREILAELL